MKSSPAQQQLEKRMADLGIQRYRSKRTKAEEKGRSTNTAAGRHLMREGMTLFYEELASWVNTAKKQEGRGARPNSLKYLELLDLDLVCFVATKVVLDGIASRRTLPDLTFQIGTALEDEYRLSKLKSGHKRMFRELEKRSKISGTKHKRKVYRAAAKKTDDDPDRWPRRDKYRLGVMLVELLRMSTGLIEVIYVKQGRRQHAYVTATPGTLEWLEKSHAAHEVLSPFYLPCVDPPKDWAGPTGGGYRTEEVRQRPLVKSYDRAYQAELAAVGMPEVYDAVNTLQATAWEVNRAVYDVMQTFWSAGTEIADLPLRSDEPIPAKPEDLATNEEARKTWRRSASEAYRRNVARRSARLQTTKILFIAEMYGEQRFFYPYSADFRGRLYPVPYFLQPQGPSQARGLLRFAEGKPIATPEAARWLAIHGANCFGVDKVSMDVRVEWAEKHTAHAKAVASDPFAHLWWTEADKPWEFLAWCLEWAEFKRVGYGFSSKLPIAMDGSNNGLQIFSLLLRDERGAAATNCTPHDVPRDIYQDVADLVTQKLMASDNPLAKPLLESVSGRIPRACCKRPVMTLPYGSTRYSCRKYVEEWYQEHVRATGDDPFGGKWFHPCAFLSDLVWTSISEIVVAAKVCMNWLQDVARLCSTHKLGVRWISPSGFPVKQFYRKWDNMQIRTVVGESVRWTQYREERDELSRRRQVNGMSPNFVHSLDAAVMVKTVALAAARGVTSFCMIHDSYGTHAADADTLATSLRDAYVEMFSTDLLEDFRAQVQLQLGDRDTVPSTPERGELDVQEVRNSVYFFA